MLSNGQSPYSLCSQQITYIPGLLYYLHFFGFCDFFQCISMRASSAFHSMLQFLKKQYNNLGKLVVIWCLLTFMMFCLFLKPQPCPLLVKILALSTTFLASFSLFETLPLSSTISLSFVLPLPLLLPFTASHDKAASRLIWLTLTLDVSTLADLPNYESLDKWCVWSEMDQIRTRSMQSKCPVSATSILWDHGQ